MPSTRREFNSPRPLKNKNINNQEKSPQSPDIPNEEIFISRVWEVYEGINQTPNEGSSLGLTEEVQVLKNFPEFAAFFEEFDDEDKVLCDLLEKYLRHKLSDEEKNSFEKHVLDWYRQKVQEENPDQMQKAA